MTRSKLLSGLDLNNVLAGGYGGGRRATRSTQPVVETVREDEPLGDARPEKDKQSNQETRQQLLQVYIDGLDKTGLSTEQKKDKIAFWILQYEKDRNEDGAEVEVTETKYVGEEDDKPAGEEAKDDKPAGEETKDDKPDGEETKDDKPAREEAKDDKPDENEKKNDADDEGEDNNEKEEQEENERGGDEDDSVKLAPRSNKRKRIDDTDEHSIHSHSSRSSSDGSSTSVYNSGDDTESEDEEEEEEPPEKPPAKRKGKAKGKAKGKGKGKAKGKAKAAPREEEEEEDDDKEPKKQQNRPPGTAAYKVKHQLDNQIREVLLGVVNPMKMTQYMSRPYMCQDEYKFPAKWTEEEAAAWRTEQAFPKVHFGVFCYSEQQPNSDGGCGASGGLLGFSRYHFWTGSKQSSEMLANVLKPLETTCRPMLHATYPEFHEGVFGAKPIKRSRERKKVSLLAKKGHPALVGKRAPVGEDGPKKKRSSSSGKSKSKSSSNNGKSKSKSSSNNGKSKRKKNYGDHQTGIL